MVSSTLFNLKFVILEIQRSPSFQVNHNNCTAIDYFCNFTIINPAKFNILVIPSIISIALSTISEFTPAINILPVSSISILTPVSSIILFITLPPVPITSRIFSD